MDRDVSPLMSTDLTLVKFNTVATHLEVDKKAVEFLLVVAMIKVLATGIQQSTDQTDTKQVFRRVQH